MRNITHETIDAYLDGSLSPIEREAFETALTQNPTLAQQVETMRTIERTVTKVLETSAPPEMTFNIMEAVSKARILPEPVPSSNRMLYWYFAFIGALVLGAFFDSPQSTQISFDISEYIPTWFTSGIASLRDGLTVICASLDNMSFIKPVVALTSGLFLFLLFDFLILKRRTHSSQQ